MSIIKNKWNDFKYGNSATVFLRISLGGMFLFSGFFKALDLETFGAIITRYNVTPDFIVPYIAIIIPFLELTIGACLVLGYKIKSASLYSILLMIVFIAAISVNVARGETFECGCFELNRIGLGIEEVVGIPLIIRDIVMLVLFFAIFRAERHFLSLENLFEESGLKEL